MIPWAKLTNSFSLYVCILIISRNPGFLFKWVCFGDLVKTLLKFLQMLLIIGNKTNKGKF